MSRANESLHPNGLGFPIMQDHGFTEAGTPLELRAAIYGIRVKGRLTGAGEFGHYHEDVDGRGDWACWVHWAPSTRSIGSWANAYPVRIGAHGSGGPVGDPPAPDAPAGEITPGTRTPVDPRDITGSGSNAPTMPPGPESSQGGQDRTPEPPQSVTFEDPEAVILPIKDGNYDHDDRYEEVTMGEAPFGAIPGGTVGVVVGGTDETANVPVFLHGDPRLVAAHHGGPPGFSTDVHDITDGAIDPDRKAPLHSMARVVMRPTGDFSLAGNRANILSWNIGRSGLNDTIGGMFTDKGGAHTRHALVSVRDGGPLDVGDGEDKHQIGVDAEGNPVNAGHLSTLSFFLGKGEDGPLKFETYWPDPPDLPYKVLVHIGWDDDEEYNWGRDGGDKTASGMWRFWSSTLIGESGGGNPVPDIPGDITPKDPPPPPQDPGPTTPGGSPKGPITPGGDRPPPTIGSGPKPGVATTPPGEPGDTPPGDTAVPVGGGSPGGARVVSGGGLTHGDPNFGWTRGTAFEPKDKDGTPNWGKNRLGVERRKKKKKKRKGVPDRNGDPNRGWTRGTDFEPFRRGDDGVRVPNYDERVRGEPNGPKEHPEQVTYEDGTAHDTASTDYKAATHLELALPIIGGRAPVVAANLRDVPHTKNPDVIAEWDATAPLAWRLHTWAAQDGEIPTASDPMGGTSRGHVYTQEPGASRAVGGTATGGAMFLPPEVSMADSADDFEPGDVDISTTTFLMGPGTQLGHGLPDFRTGEVLQGHAVAYDIATDTLTETHHDGAGGTTTVRTVVAGVQTFPAANATHTGEVTGDAALTVDPVAISNKGLVTAVGADHVLILDATDGALKKALISDFASSGGDMVAATYDPGGIAGDVFDFDNMVEGATNLILTSAERTTITNTSGTNTGDEVPATTSVAGVVEIATQVEVDAGTDTSRVVTPSTLENSAMRGEVTANTAKVTNATHTGDVTGATVLTIADEAVTLAKMAHIATDIILGRTTAATGDVEALTATDVRTLINVEDGATANDTDANLRDRSTHTGTQNLATISDAGTAASHDVPAVGDAAAGEVVKGSDTRLADARTPTAHTHTKSEITDFVESDYATGAEGDLAATAIQPGDNVSALTNDAGYTGAEPSATTTIEGVVELATTAEVDTGTDTTRAVTPAALAGSALKTKVDGIESGATADQTGAEIKAAYEAEANTNAFDDAAVTKLAGIEAGADVTDTANVTAAGALMDSEVDADLKTLTLPASTTISTFGASLVDDADEAAARATLGLGGLATESSVGTADIADGAVTAVKQETIAQDVIVGRVSTGAGSREQLTPTQARTLLNVEDGATNTPGPVYGGMYVTGGSGSTTITTGGTFYQVDQFTTASPASGVTVDPTTDNDLTIDSGNSGDFRIDFDATFTGNSGSLVQFKVYKNGAATTLIGKLTAGSGVHQISFGGILALAATDVIEVFVTSTNDSDSVTITEADLSIHRLGT